MNEQITKSHPLHPCIVQINCPELINFLDLKLVQIPWFLGFHLVGVQFQGVDDGFPRDQLSGGGT